MPDPAFTDAVGLAEYWQVSRPHIYAMLSRGLPSVKIGRARRFNLAACDAWLDLQQEAA